MIDEWLDLVHEHLSVSIRQTAGIVRGITCRRVLVDAFATGIADCHEDQRLDDACMDQCA